VNRGLFFCPISGPNSCLIPYRAFFLHCSSVKSQFFFDLRVSRDPFSSPPPHPAFVFSRVVLAWCVSTMIFVSLGFPPPIPPKKPPEACPYSVKFANRCDRPPPPLLTCSAVQSFIENRPAFPHLASLAFPMKAPNGRLPLLRPPSLPFLLPCQMPNFVFLAWRNPVFVSPFGT